MLGRLNKQTCITFSFMESENIAMFLVGREAMWMRRFLRYLLFIEKQIQPITTYYDNRLAIFTVENKRYTGKSKHISMKYNHIRLLVKKGEIVLEHLPTSN